MKLIPGFFWGELGSELLFPVAPLVHDRMDGLSGSH
jgi:hypothetical protein